MLNSGPLVLTPEPAKTHGFFHQSAEKIKAFVAYLAQKIHTFIVSLIRKCFYSDFAKCSSASTDNPIQTSYLDGNKAHRKEGEIQICIFAALKDYKTIKRHNYEHFLQAGMDVLLWNPSKMAQMTEETYAEDLQTIVRDVKALYPDKEVKVLITAYCATGSSLLKACHALQDDKIVLVLDRIFESKQALAQKVTVVAKLGCVRKAIQAVQGNPHPPIANLKNPILFIRATPGQDQMLDYGKGQNFTHDLFTNASNAEEITLPNSHHWSRWDNTTYVQVDAFLSRHGFSIPDTLPAPSLPSQRPHSWCGKHVLPILTTTWC